MVAGHEKTSGLAFAGVRGSAGCYLVRLRFERSCFSRRARSARFALCVGHAIIRFLLSVLVRLEPGRYLLATLGPVGRGRNP